MGTIDNIYTLNYLVNRNLGKKKGKLIALFVDFKAAFDLMNGRVLWKGMRETEVNEGLIEKIKEIFVETRIRVRIVGKKGEVFWTGRGLDKVVHEPHYFLIYCWLTRGEDGEERKRGNGFGKW